MSVMESVQKGEGCGTHTFMHIHSFFIPFMSM